MHGRITCALAFCVVMYVSDSEMRICNHFFMAIVKFVLISSDGDIGRIGGIKYFIDHRNDQFGHFGEHSTKGIVKDCGIRIVQKYVPFFIVKISFSFEL